jgi:hypothetical protein
VEHSGLGIIAEQFRVEGRKEKKRKKGKEKKEMQPNDGISFSPSSLSLSLSLSFSRLVPPLLAFASIPRNLLIVSILR